ncbi:hypothetical protein LJR289_004726 [Pseudoduganella sp. LjRoot289]|uniref:hypothetical protein n=1 Tax=Pseudoduganella sp. LjRoot289 TaxID=3342314 RepID=UPI003ECCADB6
MTMPIQFDTLKYARLLKEGGLPEEQAELHAEALGTVLGECQVAVESDLVLQRGDLLARMDLLKQEIYAGLDALKQEVFSGLGSLKQEVFSGLGSLKQEVFSGLGSLKQEVFSGLGSLRQEMDARFNAVELKFKFLYVLFGVQFLIDGLILAKLYS